MIRHHLSAALAISCFFAPVAAAQSTLEAQRIPTLTAEQMEILSYMSLVDLPDGQGGFVRTLRVTGVNLQIVNGLDATNGNPSAPGSSTGAVNGAGNLIVGYNEQAPAIGVDRTGSHNIVFGTGNNYESFGGMVGGFENEVEQPWSAVVGGSRNKAQGLLSTVLGGYQNEAEGSESVVSGGFGNRAIGEHSAISGGANGAASGSKSSVSGGQSNVASANGSSVSGGAGNDADGSFSSVTGGQNNRAVGSNSCVSGGSANLASGNWASVSAGFSNEATSDYTSVSGGNNNNAQGAWSTVSGGQNRWSFNLQNAWVAGGLLQAN